MLHSPISVNNSSLSLIGKSKRKQDIRGSVLEQCNGPFQKRGLCSEEIGHTTQPCPPVSLVQLRHRSNIVCIEMRQGVDDMGEWTGGLLGLEKGVLATRYHASPLAGAFLQHIEWYGKEVQSSNWRR